jgi:hypothetical protein
MYACTKKKKEKKERKKQKSDAPRILKEMELLYAIA